jgi:hypothetical protein
MNTSREVVAQVLDERYVRNRVMAEGMADAVLAALKNLWESEETDSALERYGIYATGRDIVRVLFGKLE